MSFALHEIGCHLVSVTKLSSVRIICLPKLENHRTYYSSNKLMLTKAELTFGQGKTSIPRMCQKRFQNVLVIQMLV